MRHTVTIIIANFEINKYVGLLGFLVNFVVFLIAQSEISILVN